MKIYVDKMPEKVKDCPYSEKQGNIYGATWYGCNFIEHSCLGCEETSKCRYFTELQKDHIEVKRYDRIRKAIGEIKNRIWL